MIVEFSFAFNTFESSPSIPPGFIHAICPEEAEIESAARNSVGCYAPTWVSGDDDPCALKKATQRRMRVWF